LKILSIENNTVLIFAGDNGTSMDVADHVDGDTVLLGGKSKSKESGTQCTFNSFIGQRNKPGSSK
jgi:hypothetical protein